GFAVDGHNRKIAKVAPLAELRRRNDRLNGCGLIEHFFGKPVWKVMFADDDFDIDAEVIFVSKYFHYAAARMLSCRRPVGDFYIDHDVFEIAPVAAASGFVAQNTMARFLAGSCGDSRLRVSFERSSISTAAGVGPLARGQPGRLPPGGLWRFRIFHPMWNYDLLRNFVVQRDHVIVPQAIMKNSNHGSVRAVYRT